MPITKAEFIWMDGRLVRWEEAKLPFLTHTFHYGLGVFEGIRAYETARGSAVFRLREHMKRLAESAHICRMEMPFSVEAMCNAAVELLRANQQKAAYLRPVIWYGDNEGLGLGTVNELHAGIAAFQWGTYLGAEALKNGIRTCISSHPRRPVNGIPTKAKVNGAYVNSILAKREAVAGGYDEAIMLDVDGFVVEASAENIFMLKDGELWTPPKSSPILAGITRDALLRIAADQNVPIREERFTRDMLYVADECFLTGTAAEVTPVREVDGRRIGAGVAGPLTRELQATFFRATRGEEPRYREWLTFLD